MDPPGALSEAVVLDPSPRCVGIDVAATPLDGAVAPDGMAWRIATTPPDHITLGRSGPPGRRR